VLTGLISAFFSWQIGDQLDALKNAVKKLAGGDLNTPVEILGQGAIGSLGMALERMRQQLQKKFALEIQERANTQVIGELTTLLEISAVASGSLEIRKILNILAHKTAVACHAVSCMILCANGDRLWVPLAHQSKHVDTGELTHVDLLSLPPIPSGWQPAADSTLTPWSLERTNLSDTLVSDTPAFNLFQRPNPVYSAPLLKHGGILGYLLLEMAPDTQPSESDQKLALAIGSQISSAVINSRLFESERRERKTAQSLRVVTDAISNSLNPTHVMERLLSGLGRLVSYNSAALVFQEDGKYHVSTSSGFEDPMAINGRSFSRSEIPLIGKVLESGESLIYTDANHELLISHSNRMLYAASGVLIPLVYRDRPQGVLVVNSNTPNLFNPGQVTSLEVFARSAAIALENARLFQQTQQLAITDGLTGVNNRRHFMERMEMEINRIARTKRPMSLILFDIDHFKQFNDSYGHAAGDSVLKALAARSANMLREVDTLGRLGGEEFAILLPETDYAESLQAAERLRALTAETAFDGGCGAFDLAVTISVGVATWSKSASTASQLYKIADHALYQAKHRGRNRVEGIAP